MATKINASHILVKSEEEAKSILAQINAGSSFEDLAKAKSICPSGKKGGNLGWFTHNMMVKEFEKAAFSMKKGQVSQPVKSQFGWHIIKIIDTWG
jgi:peptidyl-prolyl cis-trans isomerase C